MAEQLESRFRLRRRQLIALAVVFVLVVPILVRLVDIQVVRADQLNAEAYQRRSIPVAINGLRGKIYDSSGTILANSVMRFNITASPRFAFDSFTRTVDGVKQTITREDAIADLAKVTGVLAEDIRAALDANPESNFAYIAKSVDIDMLRAVQELRIPWLYSEQVPSRTYPNGAVAGNLVGFMSKDGPGAGVELYMNEHCLAPTSGTETYERGRDGVRIPGSTVVTQEAVNGGDIHLTINSDLQWFAQESLSAHAKNAGAQWATAVVLEVETGKLRAVAEYPTVDSNNPGATEASTWTSTSFTYQYEPGSTMKTITMAGLLDAGVITSTTGITAPWRVNFGDGVTVKDAQWHPVRQWTAAGVLTNSSNIGTILLSENLSAQKRYEYLLKAGFGSKTTVKFQGEAHGLLHNYQDWDKHTAMAVNFGQGISVTSAQMAASYQPIGNDGVKLPISLVEGCYYPDGSVTNQPDLDSAERIYSESAAKATQDMLETTVNSSWLNNMLSIDGYRIGAKTGTAQVAEQGRGYGDRAVTSIIGMVPMDDPKYIVAITYGYPSNKSTRAVAPAFREIMTQVLKTYKIQPSDSAPVKLPVTWQ